MRWARSRLRPRPCASPPPLRRATTIRAATTSKPAEGFTLFDTSLGRCAVAWRGEAVFRTALPDADEARTLARFRGIPAADPPPRVASVIARLAAYAEGASDDFADVSLDLHEGAEFDRQVWMAARRIPRGETRTYGELAREVGAAGAAQAVGLALGRNPVPILVPCHRILAGAGGSGGFSASGGVKTKFRLLALEGARRPGEPQGLFGMLPLAVKPVR